MVTPRARRQAARVAGCAWGESTAGGVAVYDTSLGIRYEAGTPTGCASGASAPGWHTAIPVGYRLAGGFPGTAGAGECRAAVRGVVPMGLQGPRRSLGRKW